MTTETTNLEFHVHDIMAMLAQDPTPRDEAQIIQFITEKFGKNSHFSSCSFDGMDAKAAFDFLMKRQKLTEVETGKYIFATNSHCNH